MSSIESAIQEIINEARLEAARSRKLGDRANNLHYTLGALAVVASIIAGVSALAEWQKWIIAGGAFTATVLTGFQTFFKAEEKAQFHYARWADYGDLANQAALLAEKNPPPTQEELQQLRQRLTDIRRTPFKPGSRPSVENPRAASTQSPNA